MELQQKKKSIMFYEICRLCLDEHGHCDIFARESLSEDIHRCIGVKVTLSDNLPQRICKSCLDIVEKATKLGVTAKKNEEHLKTLFCDEEDQQFKKTTPEPIETVTSTHFEKGNLENSCPEKISVIEKFIKVRVDLFEPSVSEASIMSKKSRDNQPDSSQRPEKSTSGDDSLEYTCNVCSKKFSKYRQMYHHTRLHNKNYACPIDVCGKRFATKADMVKHIRTHTGEKPYQCNLCEKSFSQRVTLRNHKESLHNEI